jgi:two-component system sensor histidine kinase KdpD
MRESGREQTGLEEHVLVYIDATAFSRTLIRKGWRLAQGLHGDLLVAYLRRDLAEAEQVELARTVELAEDLNARVIPLDATDEAQALATLIATHGVQHLVLGHRPRTGLGDRLKPSLADRLLAQAPHVELHLAAHQ